MQQKKQWNFINYTQKDLQMNDEYLDFINWLRENDYCRLNVDKFLQLEGNLKHKLKGLYSEFEKETTKDTIVESVISQFKERSSVGINKYGVTLDRTDLTRLEWLNHAQQESMDFCLYLEKLKQYEK
jgi:hypothetical protein